MPAECDWLCLGWPWAFVLLQHIHLCISLATLCSMYCAFKGIDSPLTAHCRALIISTLCGSAFVCVYQAANLAFLDTDKRGILAWSSFGFSLFSLVLWILVLFMQLLAEVRKKERAQTAALQRELTRAIAAVNGVKEAILAGRWR